MNAPAEWLAQGLAWHLAHWAAGRGCSPATARLVGHAGHQLSLATGEGHVCIALASLGAPTDPGPGPAGPGGPQADPGTAAEAAVAQAAVFTQAPAWRTLLLGSGVVGTPEAPGAMPLILDADDRLYLHRHFDAERRLSLRLATALAAPPRPIDADDTERLRAFFAQTTADAEGAPDWQKVAAALALRQRLTVISGGPGTGKTTTVVNLLACLLAQAPQARVALAAPTGKAAARMTEAIRQRSGHLPEALRAQLPRSASTLHRLLGARPDGQFTHHAGHPLPIDALVVDEASMLDLALAVKLLEAVPPHARIILIGDKDQLAAVEAGAVFGEIGADPALGDDTRHALAQACGTAPEALTPPAVSPSGPLRDAVVWLTRNFRFGEGSGIGRLAAQIRAGRPEAAQALLLGEQDGSLQWLGAGIGSDPDPDPSAMDATLWRAIDTGFEPYFDAVRRDPQDAVAVTRALGSFRVLCALREGPQGVQTLNERLTSAARQALAGVQPRGGVSGIDGMNGMNGMNGIKGPRSPWFVGRPVMVLRNDPLLGLYNGDIGVALPDAQGELAVFFPTGEGSAEPASAGRDVTATVTTTRNKNTSTSTSTTRTTQTPGFRAIAPVRLPEHETAFAMTVHKSQGSEFEQVLVLLPALVHRVVTRELLYTAVTRARQRVTLACTAQALAQAIRSPTRRLSGLRARLAEALDAAAGTGLARPEDVPTSDKR